MAYMASKSSLIGVACSECGRRAPFAFDGRCLECAGHQRCRRCRSGIILDGKCDQCGKHEDATAARKGEG